MYYPFIRGKQFELLMLREMAPQIAEWGFVPIIEPVKEDFSSLKRAFDKLKENNCHFILIANPSVGGMKDKDKEAILWHEIYDSQLNEYKNFSVGINLTAETELEVLRQYFEMNPIPMAIIHNGFSDGKGLSTLINEKLPNITEHVFVGQQSSSLYRKHFSGTKRVLIQDGFLARINREYPPSEPFSELYLTYSEMGCQGFGDFLIVGGDFKAGGGPARAVAIHLTYVDPAADNAIAIKHYVSDKVDTLEDPAGKFLEALRKLDADVRSAQTQIQETTAVEEYLQLFERQHFPGLGYVKKLSMQHHLELMAHLLHPKG